MEKQLNKYYEKYKSQENSVISEILENDSVSIVCYSCRCEMLLDNCWHIIINQIMLCESCYNFNSKEIDMNVQCDSERFFDKKCDNYFNQNTSWYSSNHSKYCVNLCLQHGQELMSKKDLVYEKIKKYFKIIDPPIKNIIKISTRDWYYGDDRCCLLPSNKNKPELIFPDECDKKILQDCINIFIKSDIWNSIVNVNDHIGEECPNILYDKILTSILDWIPFEEFNDKKNIYGFSLVNCNPQTEYFHTVATIIIDDHGRGSFDAAIKNNIPLTFKKYIERKKKYNPMIFQEHLRKKLGQGFYYG